jgi:hypothetical protein
MATNTKGKGDEPWAREKDGRARVVGMMGEQRQEGKSRLRWKCHDRRSWRVWVGCGFEGGKKEASGNGNE